MGDLKLGGLFPLVKCPRNNKMRKIIEERRVKFLDNINGHADQLRKGPNKKKKKAKLLNKDNPDGKLELNYEKLQVKLMQPVAKDLKKNEKERYDAIEKEDNLKQ